MDKLSSPNSRETCVKTATIFERPHKLWYPLLVVELEADSNTKGSFNYFVCCRFILLSFFFLFFSFSFSSATFFFFCILSRISTDFFFFFFRATASSLLLFSFLSQPGPDSYLRIKHSRDPTILLIYIYVQ